MSEKLLKKPAKDKISWQWVANAGVILAILDCLLLAAFPGWGIICGLLIMFCSAVLFFFDEFYILPIMFLFFDNQLILQVGTSVMSVFTSIVLLRFIIFDMRKTKMKIWLLPSILVLMLYCIFVMPHIDVTTVIRGYVDRGQEPPTDSVIRMRTIFAFVTDAAYTIVVALKLHNDEDILKKFLCVIPIVAVISGIYGITSGNIYAGVRYNGSFNDPNYFGFFINVSIFSALVMHEYFYRKKWIKIILIGILYYFLLGAGSMTGLICNIGGLGLYTIFKYRKKAVFMIFVIGIAVSGIVLGCLSIPAVRNLSVVQNLERRIATQYSDVAHTDANTLTSGRTQKWKDYSKYISELDPGRQAFGGEVFLTSNMDPQTLEKLGGYGSHQAYLSMILNIGIVGLTLMIIGVIIKVVYFMYICIIRKNELYLLLSTISAIWLVYGFVLDYFYDVRFMLFYYI